MHERKTMSMLQRIPVILAVTAASYGLPLHAQPTAQRSAGKEPISRPAASRQVVQHGRITAQR